MSYDIRVGRYWSNMTWNIRPMIAKVLDGRGPGDWSDKPAKVVRAECLRVLAAFDADPEAFRALNPPNGWGDFEGCRRWVAEIAEACRTRGRAVVRVS